MAGGVSPVTTWGKFETHTNGRGNFTGYYVGFSKPIKLGSYTIARQNVGISVSVHDDQSQKNQVIYPTTIFGSKTNKGPTKFVQKDC